MIYTVTLNPALDYVVRIGELTSGTVNRSSGEDLRIGGKGINVSIVLNELGFSSTATGFIAGFTGEAIEKGVKEKGIASDFVHLKNGFSRINVKIKTELETELNGKGPSINESEITELFCKLDCLTEGDTLVLAGSIPSTLSCDIYEQILKRIAGKSVRVVVDCSGEALLRVLKYHPFLVKPNHHELGEMFGVTLHNIEDIIAYAMKLKEMGALNVLISMAGDGAVLIDQNGIRHICSACKGSVRNSVGAGDSMVAGFIAGIETGDYSYALKLGTASGGATAFSDDLAKKEDIFRLLAQL